MIAVLTIWVAAILVNAAIFAAITFRDRREEHHFEEALQRRRRAHRIAALERELGIEDPYSIADGRRPLEPPPVDWQPR